MPVVSVVNGAAAGAGAGIVAAGRSAYFLTPFLPKLGIAPDMSATWFLPQHIGRACSMAMILPGDRLPAEKAVEWGATNSFG